EATTAMEEVGLRLGDASYEQGVNKDEAVVLTQNVPVGTSMFSGQKAKVTLGDKSKAPKRDDKDDDKDDDDDSDVNITKEVIKGTAYIRIENKSVQVDDATTYTVCIIADQPTLGRSTVYEKSMTGADIKKQLSQPVEVESDCDIHLTINGEVVKTLHYNK
ncbi:MAG: hypothetical protein MJ232_02005, partial [archaeon]|nr:hypothetical protein [archaeon]